MIIFSRASHFYAFFDGVNKIIGMATRFPRLCAGLVARASWSPDWGTNPGLWRVPWVVLGWLRWMDWMVHMVFAGFDMFWWDIWSIWCCFCYRRCAMIHACNYSEGAITRLSLGTLGFQKPTQGVVGKSDRVQWISTSNRLTWVPLVDCWTAWTNFDGLWRFTDFARYSINHV